MKPCCDRKTMVAMIAMMDMTFGILLSGISAYSILAGQVSEPRSSTRLLHLFPLIVNTFQTLVAFQLLTSIMQINPSITLLKTTIWNNGAYLTLACLTIKFMALLCLNTEMKHIWHSNGFTGISFLTILTILEIAFKLVSILLIKGYLDELRIEAYRLPNVRFYSAFIPPHHSQTSVPTISSDSTPPPLPPRSTSYSRGPNWIVPTHSFAEKKLGSESIYISEWQDQSLASF